MNTIELPKGNNVLPLRSDTIQLVQNGCPFHGLWSEDLNQHLKDFLKLVDSLDLDGSISTWEDLTTRFLAQAKLRNDILMFQQHQGESLSEAWTRFKDLLQKVPHHGIDRWLQIQIFYNHVSFYLKSGGKLRVLNAEESWALLEDLALYDNESWNDQKDFAKLVKATALPQDGPSTSDCCLIELKNQVQCLMEAHLALMQPTQVNKVTTSCEICSGPHDTQYCMEDPEQAFVEYASSRTDKVGGEMTNKIDTVLKAITDQIAGTLPSYTVKNPKPSTSSVLSASSYPTQDPQCSNHVHGSINAITIHPKHPEGSQVNRPDKGQGRIKGMHVFVGNFTYTVDFMIIEDISLIIDLRLSQVVLGKPFVEISNMTHDPQEGVVRFTNGKDEVSYKMPHKIEQYSSLSNIEKEHTKSVYLRNKEYKRRGVEYVMSKILGFYKECLELGPEYLTRIEDEGEVT
ncbi:MAK10-like protein [Tanacetum coccineum]